MDRGGFDKVPVTIDSRWYRDQERWRTVPFPVLADYTRIARIRGYMQLYARIYIHIIILRSNTFIKSDASLSLPDENALKDAIATRSFYAFPS